MGIASVPSVCQVGKVCPSRRRKDGSAWLFAISEPMTRHLTERDVRGMAEYARIGLSEEEVGPMTVDLNAILDSLAPITEYDLEGVEPTFHPVGDLSNVMREDVEGDPAERFTQEQALSDAPACQDGSFLIPSILGEGGDR